MAFLKVYLKGGLNYLHAFVDSVKAGIDYITGKYDVAIYDDEDMYG